MPEKQPISLASTVSRSEDHLSAEIDNELVLMDIEHGNYYGLDAIGTDIWRRLDGQVVVSDLCIALGEEYDADAETIQRDVLVLLKRLIAEGLIAILPLK
ncbi:MAG: PqqD family protein [Spirochaetota bacterium]